MKQLQLIFISFCSLMASTAFAAPVSIGPYLFNDDARATSASFSGSVFENVSGAITDNLDNTYIKGLSSDAGVSLTFGNTALSNQAGDDLALFFLTANNTVTLDIGENLYNLTSSQLFVNSADPFTDIGEKYMVENVLLSNGNIGVFDLSVIFIDLDEYGIGLNESLNNIDLLLGNGQSYMSYAVGMHGPLTAVPVPAAAWLFITGLLSLGFASRRKR